MRRLSQFAFQSLAIQQDLVFKPCSHITSACAFALDANNGFHGNNKKVFTLNICVCIRCQEWVQNQFSTFSLALPLMQLWWWLFKLRKRRHYVWTRLYGWSLHWVVTSLFQETMNRTSLESIISFLQLSAFSIHQTTITSMKSYDIPQGHWVSRHFYLRSKYQWFIHNSK